MKINNKNIMYNSFLLLILETLLVVLLFIVVGRLLTDNDLGYLSITERILSMVSLFIMLSFSGILAKLVMELLPKILIQKFLIKKYSNNLSMIRLWLYFFIFGLLISIIWWSQAEFKFKMNLNTSVAIFNLLAISVSPFILKKLGWDIIERALRGTTKEGSK